MKKYLRPILLLLVAGSIFSSCKKDSKQSNTDKLCGKDWKTTAITISPAIDIGGGVMVTDLYNQPLFTPDCVKDDFINFNKAGTYIDDEGATKCDVADPQTVAGTWTWNSDETVLTQIENGSTSGFSVTILVNDGTTLSGTYPFDNGSGVVYTITQTFKKK